MSKIKKTEVDWLAAKDLASLDPTSYHTREQLCKHRRPRLFGIACTRAAMTLFPHDTRFEILANAAEKYADEQITWDAIKIIRRTIISINKTFVLNVGSEYGQDEVKYTVLKALNQATNRIKEKYGWFTGADYAVRAFAAADRPNYTEGYARGELIRVALARDIFGNPFRPVTFDPAWRTPESISIAGRMYDSRDFSAMPILADALEETGCTNSDVLLHCRQPSVHVRGCWVDDLVLGKS